MAAGRGTRGAPRGTHRFRIAAAALAAAPVGFAAGVLFAAWFSAEAETADGLTLLGAGLGGALVAAALMALAAVSLPPKPARIATLIAAGASFAILVYMVQDFVRDRLAQAAAFDAAYERMPRYQLTLHARDARRGPFSELTYDAEARSYRATRPGGWLCTGTGSRAQTFALFEAMQATAVEAQPVCAQRVSWTTGEAGEALHGCVDDGNAAFAAADELVEASARKASCRRAAPGAQDAGQETP